MNTQPSLPLSRPHWLDRFSWPVLLILTAWLSVAPIEPEPHLIEKIRMLLDGTLSRPLDIFDLCLHSAPWVVVGLKLRRHLHSNKSE